MAATTNDHIWGWNLRRATGQKYEVNMTFEKAAIKDISMLTDLRIAYLQEDLGTINDKDLSLIQESLPSYYAKHLNQDLMVYAAKEGEDIVSCAFLLIVEKPASPLFITGKTGTVLNVYTKPEYRHKGYAKQLMTMMYGMPGVEVLHGGKNYVVWR